MILYNFVDKFLMNDFNSEIKNRLNHKNPIIFDVGCFNGNFSRKLIKDLKLKKVNFYLFDANPNLRIKKKIVIESLLVSYVRLNGCLVVQKKAI